MADETTTGAPPPAAPAAGPRARSLGELVDVVIARAGVLIAFVIMLLVFSLHTTNFFTAENFKNIIQTAAPQMILALGLTAVLVMRDFDLSIGSMVGLAAGAAVAEMAHSGVAWQLAVLLAIGLGVGAGLFNGFLVAVLKGNSFIMTLAMATILTGIEYTFTSQDVVFQGVASSYTTIGAGSSLGLNNQVWIALAVAAVLWILLDATEIGRFMYAIGGNQEAARLSGIRVRLLRTSGFVIVAVTATIAGIVISNSGYTPNPGQYLLLPAYAGAFLGAACFRFGEFNIPGTIVGVLFLGTIDTGLTIEGLATKWINIVQGAILIVAVLLSSGEATITSRLRTVLRVFSLLGRLRPASGRAGT